MGVDYHPSNSRVEPFRVNISGADQIGYVHRHLRMEHEENPMGCLFGVRVPWKANRHQTQKMFDQLNECTDAEIIKSRYSIAMTGDGGDDVYISNCFNGTDEEFVEWVRRWQTFLEHCSGYEGS